MVRGRSAVVSSPHRWSPRSRWIAGLLIAAGVVVAVADAWRVSRNASPLPASGSAAVPLWSRFMLAVRPAGGFPAFAPPPGLIDAEPIEPGATITTAPLVMPASFHESTLEAPAGEAAWYEPPTDLAAGGERRGVILIRRHGGP